MLFNIKTIPKEKEVVLDKQVQALINRRRHQILVHSCIYYELNTSIISDHLYDAWSKELVKLQTAHPNEANACLYHEEFKDWDGSSGFDLPTRLPNIIKIAMWLLQITKEDSN